MKWFGPTWDAPVCEEGEEVPTPEGRCLHCRDEIVKGERGLMLTYGEEWVPVHLHCLTKAVLGR